MSLKEVFQFGLPVLVGISTGFQTVEFVPWTMAWLFGFYGMMLTAIFAHVCITEVRDNG